MIPRQRLSQRTRGLPPDGPFEGVPAHLQALLVAWYSNASHDDWGAWDDALQYELAALSRVAMPPGLTGYLAVERLLRKARSDDEVFLDVVDARLSYDGEKHIAELQRALDLCASVWRVNQSEDGLERRVNAELSETVALATSPKDEASDQLREAWSNAYGRNGNPSDAWDHAIKAIECLLCPEVVPRKAKPTLGDVLGVLRANDGNKWRGSLPGKDKDHPVAPVVGALDLLWPNPDRHGEPNPRPPTEEEARSVVAIAAALVQSHRETPLVYKVP